MGRGAQIWLWSVTAALAGFLFGFDTVVISGGEQAIQKLWSLTPTTHGLAMSSALWGTVLGALGGAIPSDRFGRKPTLIAIGLLYALSSLGSALAQAPTIFMIMRFLGGIGIGVSSIAAPAYISEIAPPAKRGRLVALYQFNIVAGILIAFFSNYLLRGISDQDWRWMLGVMIIPSIAYLLAVLLIPESPRWLAVKRGRVDQARAILAISEPETADAVLASVMAETQTISLKQFFSGQFSKPIMLAFLIAFFNQLSGINAILYYAPRIFEKTGLGASAALLAGVGIGVTNLLFTLLGVSLIDKLGRKTLMLIGSLGYLLSLGTVAWGFGTAHFTIIPWFIFLFIAAHAIGQGTVIWVYISEIFPNAARARGQALGSSTHWVLAALLTLFMPVALASIEPGAIFLLFFGMMALQLLFVLFLMVETKGQSLESLSQTIGH
jgi:sugar porter (SP) family MFS transporter